MNENTNTETREGGEKKMNLKTELLAEGKRILFTAAIVLIILQIAFYKEPFLNTAKFSLSFLYFSLLPGYALMMLLASQLKPELRIILSFPVGLAVYAVSGYYLNMIWPVKYLMMIPLAILSVCIGVYYLRTRKIRQED